MARRPAMELPQVPMPALPRFEAPSKRALAAVGAIAGVLLVGYALARETSLFAVRTVQVSGAPSEVAAEIRGALRDVRGDSLVALDPDDVEARVLALPSVRRASVDRSFPHGLLVAVEPERPLALLTAGSEAWVVSAAGRVLRGVESRAGSRLPRIRLWGGASPQRGERLGDPELRLALGLLRALPRNFPVRVLSAEAQGGDVSLVVEGWVRILLGPPDRLEAKLAAAGAVLRSLPPEERSLLGYLDASIPERVVAGAEAQPESEG
jgi:cell division protein FtsQ